jgi:hypothetical protein
MCFQPILWFRQVPASDSTTSDSTPDPVPYFPASHRLHVTAVEAPAQPGQSALSLVQIIMGWPVCSDSSAQSDVSWHWSASNGAGMCHVAEILSSPDPVQYFPASQRLHVAAAEAPV